MKELIIESEIKKQIENLVKEVEELVENKKIWEKDKGMEKSQLRNVLNIAISEDCVPVVLNFIKYQIGRDDKSKNWRVNNFGDELIKRLEELEKVEETVISNSKNELRKALLKEIKEKKIKEEDKKKEFEKIEEFLKEQKGKVWSRLTQLYLGFLSRYFIYKKET